MTDRIVQKRLVMGTAQLGLNYGIANETGKPDLDCAESIIKTAWDCGINEFDTAQAYGDSETVLGRVFKRLSIQDQIRVITKPNPAIDHLSFSIMDRSLSRSLNDLCVKKIYCYMLHQEDLLNLWDRGLNEILTSFKKANYIEKIGVSVYSPSKALEAIRTNGIDCVQIPSNILDRRFEDAGVFHLADEHNKKLYIRSIFLQGLILIKKSKLNASMGFADSAVSKIGELSSQYKLSSKQLAMGYVKEAYPNAKIVFGAEIPSQISENLECWNTDYSNLDISAITKDFNSLDDRILDPSKWG